MRFDLRQLRTLVAVIECGGFARAGEQMNVTQPAISASIAQLEGIAGVSLIERGAFGARPTAAGRHLYQRAKLILAEIERAGEELGALRDGEGGAVTIGIGPLFEHSIIPEVLADFLTRHPRFNITTIVDVTENLLVKLARGELDFTISSPTKQLEVPPEVRLEVLEETSDVVVAASDHPLWKSADTSLATLAEYPWIMSASVTDAARSFFAAFANAGIPPPKTLVRTDSIPILRELVLDRHFLCIVSAHFAHPSLSKLNGGRQMRIVSSINLDWPRRICLAERKNSSLMAGAQELREMIRQACSVLMKPGKAPGEGVSMGVPSV